MPFRETTAMDVAARNLGFGIDVTTGCNLDCITCYYKDSLKNRPVLGDPNMSMASFEKAMSEAALAGFQEIYVLGGEPTIHPRILDLLRCAKAHKFKQVLLVTNGIRLAEAAFCREIAAVGADIVVQRHVVGTGERERQIQDLLVGRKGTLDRVNLAFANIESIFSPGRVAVQCCITRPAAESGQIYSVFRYAKKRGYEHVIECSKASVRFARGNPLDLSPFELSQVYARLRQIDVEEFNGADHPMTPQAYGKTCHMPENSVHCLADGTIVPCVGQPFPLGNIFVNGDTSLAKILHSRRRDFFRRPADRLHGHCRDCSHLAACTGGCRGDAFFLTGCFSASAVQCPQVAAYRRELGMADFVPASCKDCELEADPICGPRKGVDEVLSKYIGPKYRKGPSA